MLHDFLSLSQMPVTCTSIFPSLDAARAVPGGDIVLAACGGCGLVFNRAFDPKLGELGARYESSQAASTHFSAFASGLADDWVRRYSLRGKILLEVGCGSGDFLQRALHAGVQAAIGVDPLAQASSDPRIRMVSEAFSAEKHDFGAHALVCRHTLEHVADVADFLRQVRRWVDAAPNRVALFELPDSQRIFTERAFWDVYYEHCNYFTEASVRAAFNQAGLNVVRSEIVYGGQYLLVEAVANGTRDAFVPLADETYDEFASAVSASVNQCRQTLRRLVAETEPVVLWQGAAKTVGLLSFLGETCGVHCAVDLNPQRHSQFLPGTGLSVMAPEALRDIQPRHVVLMNAVYMDEVRAALAKLNVPAQLHSINDLLRVWK